MASVIIENDAFLYEIEPDPNAFVELIVPGIIGIPQRLTELEYIPEHNKGAWVTSVIRVDDYGQPREAFLSVFRDPQNHKFKAKKLFKDAPEPANIRLADLNYHAFNFPPSSNCSNWLSSADLNMTVMRTNNFSKDGEYDRDEWAGINVGDASFRLVITPQDDVNKVSVSMVAVPRKLTEISSLPGNPTGLCPGYPVIEVFRLVGMMTGIQEPVRRDGFPFIPVLLHTGETDPVPDIGAIKTALYSFWNSCRDPNMGDLEMWLADTAGPAAPNADQLDCVYRWPDPATPAGPDDEEESSCDDELEENENAASQRLREMRARKLAAEINRVNGQPLPSTAMVFVSTTTTTMTTASGGASWTTTTSTTPSRMSPAISVSSGKTGTSTTTTSSLVGSSQSHQRDNSSKKHKKKKSKKSKKSKKRSRRDTESSSSGTNSCSDDDELPASQILNKEDWPVGYSAAAIDKMGVTCALKLATKNEKKRKRDMEQLPGIDVNHEEVKVATINIGIGQDNADDILHPQRFELRPPMSDPAEWYKRIKVEWPERVSGQFAAHYLGTDTAIPASTFLAANRRTRKLQCVHYMGRNYGVETRKKNFKSKITDTGETVSEGYELPFYEPRNVTDIIMACCNLQAVMYQIWPWDYTPQVILRVAARYDFFSEGRDKQVKIFKEFFDAILATNAKNPHKPPQTYEQAVLIAIAVMEKNHTAPVVPLVNNYYNKFRDPNQNQEAIAPNGGRGRGRGTRGQYANVGDRSSQNGNIRGGGNQPSKPGIEVGKVAMDSRLLKIGKEQVCRNYNTPGGCRNTMDAAKLACVNNGVQGPVNRLHVCCVVTKAGRGGDIRLCGASKHNAQSCPNKK